MAMSVLNNTATMLGLGELNKNITKVGKDLAKISSGQRIASVGDGPSDYAISEKMRTRIRGLNQCDQNTQTGKNMIEVAAGAVGNQLEALKKLREIALKSSDDTYTDFDRDILQKEASQLLQEIDDIAYETNYNGKLLLNGITHTDTTSVVPGASKTTITFDSSGATKENTVNVVTLNTSPPSTITHENKASNSRDLPANSKTYGTTIYKAMPQPVYDPTQPYPLMTPTQIQGLGANSSVFDGNGVRYSVGYTSYGVSGYDYLLTVSDGTNNYVIVDGNGQGINYPNKTPVSPTDFPAGYSTFQPHSNTYAVLQNPAVGDKVTTDDTVKTYPKLYNVVQNPTVSGRLTDSLVLEEDITDPNPTFYASYSGISEYKLDFPGLSGINFPADLKDQGLSILCAGCGQFVSIMFDTNSPIGSGEEYPSKQSYATTAFKIGVSGVTNENDLARALFEGMKAARPNAESSADKVVVTGTHDIRINKVGNDYYLTKNGPEFALYSGFKGELKEDVEVAPDIQIGSKVKKPYQDFRIQGETKASMYTTLRFNNTTLKVLFPPEDSDFDIDPEEGDYPNPWPNEYLYMSDIDKEYYDKKYDCEGDEEKIRREKWRDEFWPYPRKGAVPTETAVRSRDSAKKFIGDIDNAIKYILDTSTSFGSQSMRMTIMNSNIVSANENTQAAESVIRDADMAKEMVSFARDNILQQSSQAMLSQANQNVSSVLSLLQ